MQLVGSGLGSRRRSCRRPASTSTRTTIVERLTDRTCRPAGRDGVPWRPGARELLAGCASGGDADGAGHDVAAADGDAARRGLGFDAFDVIVAGDMVTNAKPHPEPYLRAAELLGVQTRDCVAIEDSVPGLAAAVASGAVTIGVPHMVPLAEGAADVLWPTPRGAHRGATSTAVYTATRKHPG